MEKIEYVKLEKLEKTYWWHKGKLHLVERLVGELFKNRGDLKILEIGSGTGNIIKRLEKYGEVWGIDVSSEAIEAAKRKGLKNIIQADINDMPIQDNSGKFNLILALDVLEHIQDDTSAIRRCYQMLKEGGIFLVNVPAHKFLWSEHDEALHHKRRYSITEITRKLEDCGFTIKKKSFFVTAFFPAILSYRLLRNFFTESTYPKTSYVLLPKKINDLMTYILKIEALLLIKTGLPFGTTIVVIAKKQVKA